MQNVFSEIPNHDLFQWSGSHSDFVTMVLTMSGPPPTDLNDPDAYKNIDALGELMLKLIRFDIAPYPDFQTMRKVVPPSVDYLVKILVTLESNMAFDEAVDDTGVALSSETQIENMLDIMLSEEMVRRMRPYVRFKDDPEGPTSGVEGRDWETR